MIDTKNLIQIAFVVRDIEKYLENYAALLGVEVPPVIELPPSSETGAQYDEAPMNASARLAYLDFNNISLEFIEPVAGSSIWQDFLDEKGEGVHHFAFETDNSGRAVIDLEKMGYPCVQKGSYEEGYYTYHRGLEKLLVDLEILDES